MTTLIIFLKNLTCHANELSNFHCMHMQGMHGLNFFFFEKGVCTLKNARCSALMEQNDMLLLCPSQG